MVAVAPAGAEDPAAEVREDPAGSEAPGESGGKVTRPQGWQKRNCCQKRTRRNERLQKNKSHGHSYGNSLRCAPIPDCHRQSECSEPMRKRVCFADFRVFCACAGSLLGTGCKKPCHPKGCEKNPMRSGDPCGNSFRCAPTQDLLTQTCFRTTPPAVRMFRTHAQAGLFCGFRSSLRLRRVACWYGSTRTGISDCHRQSECSEPIRKRVCSADFGVLFACAGS